MKIVIFAGGIGTRLWPLSRKNSPKQFDKIFEGKSTLQLAVERVEPVFGLGNVYIQTVPEYKDTVMAQIAGLPSENIFIEPSRRNIGPAVCLAMHKLRLQNYHGAVAVLWADHLMSEVKQFQQALLTAEKLVDDNSKRFIFWGETPGFGNNNVGWIRLGEKLDQTDGFDYFAFKGWKYRPEQTECQQMFASGQYLINTGYFIGTVDFFLDKFEQLAHDIYRKTKQVALEEDLIKAAEIYNAIAKIHFDNAIAEKIELNEAIVLKTDMGWSDPGTLYALKEALQAIPTDNIIKGDVVNLYSEDCLVYNLRENKLVATVGLSGIVVVNTEDALIVVHKEKVREVTKLVEKVEEEGRHQYL